MALLGDYCESCTEKRVLEGAVNYPKALASRSCNKQQMVLFEEALC